MGIGIWELLLIMAIVLLLFGTRKLRHIGADLGAAIKGFKEALHEEQSEKQTSSPDRIEAPNKVENSDLKPERPQRQPLEP